MATNSVVEKDQDRLGFTTQFPTRVNVGLDVGLRLGGGVLMYCVGALVGEAMEHISLLGEWIPWLSPYVSTQYHSERPGIVTGLSTAVYGMIKSGVRVSEDTLSLEQLTLTPIMDYRFTKNAESLF